ncbi:MAG: cyclopropane fatty acyl phospholipid synthase [Anaerolineae bacterium]
MRFHSRKLDVRCFLFFFLAFFSVWSEAKIKENVSSFFADSEPQQVIEKILALADIKINGDKAWDIRVNDQEFFTRVLKDGSLGLGESYMAGWWDCSALDECMYRILRADLKNHLKIDWALCWSFFKAKLFNKQDKIGSLKVIQGHYQLGNDLFENMLDGLMAYSCGYWKKASDLDEAQKAKFDLIAQKLGFKPGMRVLDIGCGWGGFAKHVAEHYGVEVLGVTLSENQAAYAKALCEGLPVEIRIQDYRDVEGTFDRIIEIGMFEHVGKKNYRAFMELVHRCLKEDGLFMLHTIGRNTSIMTVDPWIDRYIFPNGQLPSITQIGESIEGLFVMEDWHNFSTDYDKTLMAWFYNFDKKWDIIKPTYPDPFYRMWKYYLLSCAGAFRARTLQLWQVVLSKKGVLGGYESIR